ncbi:DcrB/PsbP domain-containing protein [Flindersiella endophytica]
MNRLHKYAVAAAIAVLGLTTACSGNDAETAAVPDSDGGMTVSATAPKANATVKVPFTVKIDSSEQLGDEATGKHHVHLYFDDNEDDYLIVEQNSVQVKDAPAGKHVMHLSLRNANHSPAGAESEVDLTIQGGSKSDDSGSDKGSDDGGYDY